MTRLVFSPEAQTDLEQIGDYIAQDNPTAAIEFIETIAAPLSAGRSVPWYRPQAQRLAKRLPQCERR